MTEEMKLLRANEEDTTLIHKMQYEAFFPLYEKYHDDETSPVKETIDKTAKKIRSGGSDYYKIQFQGTDVGAIRIVKKVSKVHAETKNIFYISPLFILPEYQNQGIGFMVLQKVFKLYSRPAIWKLTTIKEEAANCHLYEKCGFVRVGKEHLVNEFMTLVDYEKRMDAS